MSVRTRIEQTASKLTASERKLAAALLSDYPYAGLATIQDLASRAEVSAPSISRFVAKIGLSGYQEFQRQLLSELKEGSRSPVEMHDGTRRVEGGYLGDFIARATQQMAASGEAITEDQFDRICTLLGDTRHDLYLLGGRVTDTIARYFAFHLGQARSGVHHMASDPEIWPDDLLRMRPGDVLFLIDFRRYQPSLLRLARAAREDCGARVVLMTDSWLSPIARHAAEVMPVGISSGTLWGTYTPGLAVAEAVATRIAETHWARTKARIESWDSHRMTDQKGTP